jgi:hypothetical protein
MAKKLLRVEVVEVAWTTRCNASCFTRVDHPCHLGWLVQNAPNCKVALELFALETQRLLTMSRSNDPGHFFQTDASESTRARRAAKSGNKNGNPIVLKSKILSVIPDPFSPTCIYVAESAGCVRKVNVEVGTIKKVGRGEVQG